MSFLTIRQTAKQPECPVTEFRLRCMVAEGKVPGVRVGNRFLVDLDALVKLLRAEALSNVEGAK